MKGWEEVTLQTRYMYSTLKRCGNGRFHVYSTWNTCITFFRNKWMEVKKAFPACSGKLLNIYTYFVMKIIVRKYLYEIAISLWYPQPNPTRQVLESYAKTENVAVWLLFQKEMEIRKIFQMNQLQKLESKTKNDATSGISSKWLIL